ncbi:hypothetical protein EON79_18970 [bacterium]|nr:MAG: hypothetical protein EON79_18970 [bacterium]
MSSFEEWLTNSSVPDAPVFPGEISALEPEPSTEDGPSQRVIPCLAIGSYAYRRAPLGAKFRAATQGTIPDVLPVQRELQRMVRSRGFDPWVASGLLQRIEAYVASRKASPEHRQGAPFADE